MSEFDTAHESSNDLQLKWKQLGDLALSIGEMDLSVDCAKKAGDLSGLLLMYSAYGNREGTEELMRTARSQGKFNVAFAAAYTLGDVDTCVDMLIEVDRVPEAALFARSYAPSRVAEVVTRWKDDLRKISPVAAQALADPGQCPEGFPEFDAAVEAESVFRQAQHLRGAPSRNYRAYVKERDGSTDPGAEEGDSGVAPLDPIALVKAGRAADLVSGPGFIDGDGASPSSAPALASPSPAAPAAAPAPALAPAPTPEPSAKVTAVAEEDDADDLSLLASDDEETPPEPEPVKEPEPESEPAAEVSSPPPQTTDAMDDADLDELLNDDFVDEAGDDETGDINIDDEDDIDLDDLDLDEEDDDEWS